MSFKTSSVIHHKTHKNEDCHLGRVTLNNLKKWKEAIFQVELSSDEVNTHEEVRLRSVRVAGGLQSRGLGVGDVIVICGNTHNDICLPILASFYLGCIYFPFSNTMTIVEVKRMLEQGTPKIIFCDPCMEEIFTRALQELNIHVEIVIFGDVHRDSDTTLTHITPFSEFLKPTGTEDNFEVTDFDPDTTIAAIICSSGSTGLPKGVCHTHTSLALGTYFLSESEFCYYSSGYFMNFSTYYWVSGTLFILYTCLSGTPRLNCSKAFSLELLNKGLTKYKPFTLFVSPFALYETLKSSRFEKIDFSCLKVFLLGGSPISDNSIASLKNKLKYGLAYLAYGSTETGQISINKEYKIGSVGKPLPWIQWKIVDMETGRKVRPGEHGELCVKTETLFKCYLNNTEATNAAFDEDGYFKMGDLFTYDKEGFLYYIDRVKELIKFRNFQVTPTEIEIEIRKLADVLHVCVVGKKHDEDGDHPLAFVQKSRGSNLTEQDVKDAVKNVLADHKQLRGGVIFMETLPLTGSGKISRNLLREMAQNL